MAYSRFGLLLVLVACVLGSSDAFAQTGKIAGVVVDAETGEVLPGVNIIIEGTTQGASTDADGYYDILNLSPGTYDLRATFIGFAPQVIEDVRVNIDLTTQIDIEMQPEALGLGEVVVEASEPVVKRDISANVANLSSEEIQNIPVSSMEGVIGLQAGVESGMRVRGSDMDQLAVLVDGMSMRDGRNNEPFTGISYTAIDQIQIQTGGFNAEYGNVRSGLVNVVTKEGPRNRYVADVLARYTSPHRKYFTPGGVGPEHPDNYFLRPYLDPDVAMGGTHAEDSAWDFYEQQQYPQFRGWEAVSAELAGDDDPTNDLTPEEAMEYFRWIHRKDFDIDKPDYTIDGSIGGPVPGIGRYLGDLRFMASYRQNQSAYAIPQVRDRVSGRTGQVKFTSDLTSQIKLTLQGLYGVEQGVHSGSGRASGIFSPTAILSNASDVVYANDVFSIGDVERLSLGARITHVLGPNTFYNFRIQRMKSDYFAAPGSERSDEIIGQIGSLGLTEAPFGWILEPIFSLDGSLRMGGHWAEGRDSSEVETWTADLELTSQLNRVAQFKVGLEYNYSDYQMNHREVGFFPSISYPIYKWNERPRQGAAYAQTKLEFQGMVANLGVRLDYFDPATGWYDFSPYSRAFSPVYGFEGLDELGDITTTESKRQLALSPRLGVSFPVTSDSKLFFNYGHFRQMLYAEEIFLIRKNTHGAVDLIGNPDHPMPLTVAYELGYEQNIFDRLLLRMTGYYKALRNQTRHVTYQSLDGQVAYDRALPLNYGDIRGFEVSLSKNTGRWVRGFLNYTYMSAKNGNFGFSTYFENRSDQRLFEQQSRAHYINRAVPQPFARANIELFTDRDFGPSAAGTKPFANWHLNLLGSWRAGEKFTWDGGSGIRGLENNVRWADSWNLDLRLGKDVHTSAGELQLFLDVDNVFNRKRMRRGLGFEGGEDFRDYMSSLHLPESTFDEIDGDPYAFIYGNDRPGDYRASNVEFVPIEVVETIDRVSTPAARPIYYERANDRYLVYSDGAWTDANPDRVSQVLEDKAYINMPNISWMSFLNPRTVTFGLRLSL